MQPRSTIKPRSNPPAPGAWQPAARLRRHAAAAWMAAAAGPPQQLGRCAAAPGAHCRAVGPAGRAAPLAAPPWGAPAPSLRRPGRAGLQQRQRARPCAAATASGPAAWSSGCLQPFEICFFRAYGDLLLRCKLQAGNRIECHMLRRKCVPQRQLPLSTWLRAGFTSIDGPVQVQQRRWTSVVASTRRSRPLPAAGWLQDAELVAA